MAERSNAAVLKTVEVKASGGSNPSLSADRDKQGKALFVPLLLLEERLAAWAMSAKKELTISVRNASFFFE